MRAFIVLFVFHFLASFNLLFAQTEIEMKRHDILEAMRQYLEFPRTISNNHTNKWQNNYYCNSYENNGQTITYFDESTYYLNESIFETGAPYGYGIKDEPTEYSLGKKINDGAKVNLSGRDTLEFSFHLDALGTCNGDSTGRFCLVNAIFRTCITWEAYLQIIL